MQITYKHTQGSQAERPKIVDTESSKTVVYLRKNIERVTKVDSITENEYEVWQYDEATISHSDYMVYLNEMIDAKIDYLTMITDVDEE